MSKDRFPVKSLFNTGGSWVDLTGAVRDLSDALPTTW